MEHPQKRPALQRKRALIPIAVLVLGALLSIVVWQRMSADREYVVEAAFEKDQGKLLDRLQYHFDKQEDILLNLQEIYKSYVQIVRDVFELYTAFPTILYPGVRAICFAPKVRADDAEMFILNARMEGYYSYHIYPERESEVYFPILYAVPLTANKPAVGYDLDTDPVRAVAIARAQDSAMMIATDKTHLSTSTNDSGFVLLAPVYFRDAPVGTVEERRANLEGIVCVEIESQEFFKAVAESGGTDKSLEIQVFSASEANPDARLYSSIENSDPLFTTERSIRFAGAQYMVQIQSSRLFEREYKTGYETIILIGGLLLSIILAFLAHIIIFHTTLFARRDERKAAGQ